MNILLLAATPPETRLCCEQLGIAPPAIGHPATGDWQGHRLTILHTGIGMVNTAYRLGRYFLQETPELAIQIGIAGAFAGGPEMKEVVEVRSECYADLGAESPEGFLDLREMGFENFRTPQELYFNELLNPNPPRTGLRACRGITVNRVHGLPDSIAEAARKWQPEVESMEGAAFFQCCLLDRIPFLQLRGISNRVEPRNRAAWQVREASEAVQRFAMEYLRQL